MWTYIIGGLVSLTLLAGFASGSDPHRRASLILAASFGVAFIIFKCPLLNTIPARLVWQSIADAGIAFALFRWTGLESGQMLRLIQFHAAMIAAHMLCLGGEWAGVDYNDKLYLQALDVLYCSCLFLVIWGARQHGFSLSNLSFHHRDASLSGLPTVGRHP